MSQSRDFGPSFAEMKSALERYSKEELIDLMTHLFRVYVLNNPGSAPQPEFELPKAPAELGRMSFAQLILHLQMSLELEELGRFRVSGRDVYVTIGEQEFDLLGPSPEAAQDPAALAEAAAARFARPGRSTLAMQADDEPPPIYEEGAGRREAPPGSPVTGEPDFELDDAIDRRIASRQGEEASDAAAPPQPERMVNGGREQRRERSGPGDALFGGGGRRPSATPQHGNVPLASMEPPPPPPPIASSAPGDLSTEERRSLLSQQGSGGGAASDVAPEGQGRRRGRAGFDEGPPPLVEGDKEVAPSNRFADLDLD